MTRAWMPLGAAVLGWAALAPAQPAATMRYIHNAPESATDTRYEYQWKVLGTALEKTRPEFGPYEFSAAESMTEQRQRFELTNATGRLTVMYLGTTAEME